MHEKLDKQSIDDYTKLMDMRAHCTERMEDHRKQRTVDYCFVALVSFGAIITIRVATVYFSVLFEAAFFAVALGGVILIECVEGAFRRSRDEAIRRYSDLREAVEDALEFDSGVPAALAAHAKWAKKNMDAVDLYYKKG